MILQRDFDLLRQSKLLHLRASLMQNVKDTATGNYIGYQVIDQLEGYITEGSGTEDSDSDIRRTCNFTIHSYDASYNVGEYNRIWLNNRVRIEIGFEQLGGSVAWYSMGIFVFDSCSYSYTGSSRDITFQCSDLVQTLNGSAGGVVDTERKDGFYIEGVMLNDTHTSYNGTDIRDAIISWLKLGNVTEYVVDTVGQVSCLQNKCLNWKENRIETGSSSSIVDTDATNKTDTLGSNGEGDGGSWHMIPYDIEHDAGTDIWTLLTELRDLYSGYEMFFDRDGVFICRLIPTCEHDLPFLTAEDFIGLVIDETYDLDFTSVKNMTRIYGQSIDYDYIASENSVSNNKIILDTVSMKDGSKTIVLNNDIKLAFYVDDYGIDIKEHVVVNVGGTDYRIQKRMSNTTNNIKKMPINGITIADGATIPSYAPNGYNQIDETTIYQDANGGYWIYVKDHSNGIYGDPVKDPGWFKITLSSSIDMTKENASFTFYRDIAYGELNEYKDNYVCIKYNQRPAPMFVYEGSTQISALYVENSPECPFAVDKIGARLQVLSGGDYDNITTSVRAAERAKYESYMACRATDTVTLTMVLIPFLETNQKVQYRRFSDGQIDYYITKSINYSFTDGTMTLTMQKFYELDPSIACA